ncbi:MAG: NAD(P)-dependent glycerol-3-phosphate dehydrogenase [Acidiferrobacterales bacterium]|nr:NAD(P)-dependent glycerol-3-phosphate dehydrogenase [Acidiferrobacterales bacterium]
MSALKDQSISVIGAGSWGTALAILLAQNLGEVRLWGRNGTAQLESDRSNERYLPGVSFPAPLTVVEEFKDTVTSSLNFLIVVPSHAFRATLEELANAIDQKGLSSSSATLLWGTKGFDANSGDLLSEVVEDVFPDIQTYGVVSGPSFAAETAKGMPTGLSIACNNDTRAEQLSAWFRTATTRVYFTDDMVGVQLGGAIKNVMAVATGISDGLGYGANARAALITRGLAEMTRLGCALGGKANTFSGLAGVGDLILTCTDNQSRNRRFGLGIGAGRSREQVVAEIGQEIESINTAKELYLKASGLGIEMPITEQVYEVLHNDVSPDIAVKRLLARDPKAEGI